MGTRDRPLYDFARAEAPGIHEGLLELDRQLACHAEAAQAMVAHRRALLEELGAALMRRAAPILGAGFRDDLL